jgi:hypothetical protein
MKNIWILLVADLPNPTDDQACKNWTLFEQYTKDRIAKAANVVSLGKNVWLLPLSDGLPLTVSCLTEAVRLSVPTRYRLVSLES